MDILLDLQTAENILQEIFLDFFGAFWFFFERKNENDGGLGDPESAGLQKGSMLLLELETDQKKIYWKTSYC